VDAHAVAVDPKESFLNMNEFCYV